MTDDIADGDYDVSVGRERPFRLKQPLTPPTPKFRR